MNRAFLGVVGGMGPLATADFLQKLCERTDAPRDQDHIPYLVYADCQTPDRTAFVKGEGADPEPALLAAVRHLAAQGAACIAIPCNSAHCWVAALQAAVDVPIVSILEASVAQARQRRPHGQIIGVLSTEGTHQLGIYADAIRAGGRVPLAPTAEGFSDYISPGIAAVKAGRLDVSERLFDAAAQALLAAGADQIILGCTEIPLGMTAHLAAAPDVYIDSTTALVDAVIVQMGYPLRA